MALTGGSVEHFGHFVLDFVFNLYKLHLALVADASLASAACPSSPASSAPPASSPSSPSPRCGARGGDETAWGEGGVGGEAPVVLLDDMREDLASLPHRRFYELLGALLPPGTQWAMLGQVPQVSIGQSVCLPVGVRMERLAGCRTYLHAERHSVNPKP